MSASLICYCSGTPAICPEIYYCPLFPVLDLLLILCSQKHYCYFDQQVQTYTTRATSHKNWQSKEGNIGDSYALLCVVTLKKTLYNSQENKVRWIQLVQDVTFQKSI